jgi:N-acetylglucosaminyl-diphospho-decaprenol L-rhamnosyltransferase
VSAAEASSSPAPRVGVVVVTYSPGEALDAFLDSVATAAAAHTPVVVADNGSTDGSVERAARREGVALLRTGANLGYGRAANEGVAALAGAAGARGEPIDLVLIANPDIVLEPGSLDELAAAAARWPRGGAFGPTILTPDGQVYPSARELPSLIRGLGHAVCGWWWPSNPWTRAYRREGEMVLEREAGWLSGACLLVRREAFDTVAGFDPHYFMYFEDVDLGDRLRAAGWQNVLVPAATVTHTGGHATQKEPATMVAEHHRSTYRYLADRHSHWWQAPLRLALRLGLGLRSTLARRSSAMSAGAALAGSRRR